MAMKTNHCYPRYGYESKESNQDGPAHVWNLKEDTWPSGGNTWEIWQISGAADVAFSHVEKPVTRSFCCMQKNHLLFTHEPWSSCGPAKEKSGSKAGLQVWLAAEHLLSIVRLWVQPLVPCAPMWNTRSWTTLFRPTVLPNSAQTQLRGWRHSFYLVCRRLPVWSPEPPHKLGSAIHVWNPTTQELEAGG